MIEPISFGLCLWFFARWAKRKMEETEASSESQEAFLALHKKHGIRYEDASGTIHAFDQHDPALCGVREKDHPRTVVDARSIHVHYHFHGSQTE